MGYKQSPPRPPPYIDFMYMVSMTFVRKLACRLCPNTNLLASSDLCEHFLLINLKIPDHRLLAAVPKTDLSQSL